MRLFIGLPVPAELASTLARHARTISLPKARWTAPENIHLTLVFLGQVAEPALSSIRRELDALVVAPFPIRLTSLNTFLRAGVLFAEVDTAPKLLHLQAQVADHMVRSGFPSEDRPYRPHITLARFHGLLRLRNNQHILPASLVRNFSVDTINLYRSNMTPNGPYYEILAQKQSRRMAQI
jgi:2'-5' RNA ligase